MGNTYSHGVDADPDLPGAGRYMLNPQGARLIGEYNSHIGYGQDGVQVVWSRITTKTDH